MWQHPFPKETITDRFNDFEPPRKSPHRGTDYAPGAKKLIPAITDATVHRIFYSSCLGWVCEIKTKQHGLYVGHAHLYCNKHDSIDCDGSDHEDGSTCMSQLKVGDKVSRGDWVGRIGNSGACSRGAHLHATISKKSDPRWAKTFDIEKFIDQKIAKEERKKNGLRRKEERRKQKSDSLKGSQKPQEDLPSVAVPEQGQKLPRNVLEALKVVLAFFTK